MLIVRLTPPEYLKFDADEVRFAEDSQGRDLGDILLMKGDKEVAFFNRAYVVGVYNEESLQAANA